VATDVAACSSDENCLCHGSRARARARRRRGGGGGGAEGLTLDLFSGDADIYDQMGRPDVVLHMAWRDGFKHASSAHMDDLAKHVHLIENLYAGGLKHLAVMGTMHEVGYWEGAIDESSPCNPASLYGIAKNALRETTFLSAKAHDAVAQWIRAYYIVGDDKFGNSIPRIPCWARPCSEAGVHGEFSSMAPSQ